ncbi:uncharacterized protein [Diabrotica undecimpunctata]|uniref:uncharacterized protein n=1 Tax=Diabrotica undecimpunctata TaxID=50387 RepID=UPI003B6324F5
MTSQNLAKQIGGFKAQLTRIESFLNTNSDDLNNKQLIQLKYDSLFGTYRKLQDLLDHAEELSSDGSTTDDTVSSQNEVVASAMETIDRFEFILAKLLNLINHADDSRVSQNHFSNVKLPDINIKPFSGEAQEWQSFFDLFQALVLNNAKLRSDSEKFYYLKTLLRGQPLQLIESLSVTNQNLEIAISMLKTNYEDKNKLLNSLYCTLFDQKTMTKCNSIELRTFHITCKKTLDLIRNLNLTAEINLDTLLVFILERKLDYQTRRAFENERNPNELPSTNGFFEFLQKRYNVLDNLNIFESNAKPRSNNNSNFDRNTSRVSLHINAAESRRDTNFYSKSCNYCKERTHQIYKCQQFLNLVPQERHKFVKAKSLCFNCLSSLHILSSCKSLSRCQVCTKNHHSLLHLDNNGQQRYQSQVRTYASSNFPHSSHQQSENLHRHNSNPNSTIHNIVSNNITPNENSPINLEMDPTRSTSLSAVNRNNNHVLLPTALVKLYTRDNQPLIIKALLDSGSMQSFVTKSLAQKLQYDTRSQKLNISGIGNNIVTKSSEIIDIEIHSRVHPYNKFNVSCSIIDQITENLPQIPLNPQSFQIPLEFNGDLADPYFWEPNNIDLLIGANLYFQLLIGEIISLGANLPTLMNTQLGYVIAGPLTSKKYLSHTNASFVTQTFSFLSRENTHYIRDKEEENNAKIDTMLENFWEVEELPYTQSHIDEDKIAETLFQTTTRILDSGRYQVEMPLRQLENKKLGSSFVTAKQRFLRLEKKFGNDQNFYNEYKKVIEEYLTLQHAKVIPLNLYDNVTNKIKYFIPHRAVIREHSISTKLRIVYDFSAKSTSGYSLNDLTLKGYQVQDNLFDILCRFRTFKFILTADIKMMYREIEMSPKHRYLQNILWRDSPSEDFKCIELSRLSFGQNCSPFLATRVIKDIAQNNPQFPLAASALLYQTYMDDILGGTDQFSELEVLYGELSQILNQHSFSLHKWSSNSLRFLNKISDQNAVELDLNLDDAPCKILGLKWDSKTDHLKIDVNNATKLDRITKRQILSCISSCFDPLGLVNPLIVKGKLLMQELWQMKVSWDEPIINLRIIDQWEKFNENLAQIAHIKIPRFVFFDLDILSIDLHGFSDASQVAYGACIYIVARYANNSLSSNLVAAKSRVAPLKSKLTIPKLELIAMELLVKLIEKIITTFKNRAKINSINAWSDSQIALSWIKQPANNYNTFVSNRVANIQNIGKNLKWRHIKSQLNPADLLSRGVFNQKTFSFWFHGPEFLLNPKIYFDEIDTFEQIENLPEVKKIALLVVNHAPKNWITMFERFSNFSKLQNAVAYVFRFVYNMKHSNEKIKGTLTLKEISNAHDFIIKTIQQQYFATDIARLLEKELVVDKKLLPLNPFLDSSGIVRVGGRLQYADLDFNNKFPILLPANDHVVSLLIKKEHCRLGHSGPLNVLGNLRLRYWPLSGVKYVKRISKKCLTCYRFNAQTASQLMSPLPLDRVRISRAFYTVGVDFAGPLFIRASRLRKAQTLKCYFAIFVCMATKAIHLELVSELSSNAFLATFKRFISRRGNPHTIYSDNGTNFVGANNQLKELNNFFRSNSEFNKIRAYLAQTEIQWKFIPPRSPHWGGLWESAVKSTKFHLVRLMSNSVLTFEELYTVLTQIEAILNSRPLYALSNDPNDLQPLTPGHFLIGTPLTAFPEIDVTNTPVNRLSIWKQISKIQQSFWKRWSADYLNNLQHRPKWLLPNTDIKVNDLVLITSENTPPLRWPLARVIESISSKDGKVRIVRVRTADGEYIRPITKLIPLPLSEADSLL